MARTKKPLNIYADPDLIAELEAWIKSQEAPWNKTAVVELSLREFLDKRTTAKSRKGE